MLNTIAQLVMFTGLIGRVSALQTVIISTIFNIIWNLNHFLCVTVFTNSPNKSIFDDYQISNVYLFGACFGIVLSLFLPKEVKLNPSFSFRKVTGPIALIGTFFIYLSFCVSTSLFVQKLG